MADETTQAPEPTIAGLDAQRRRIKARKAAPPLTYDCPHSGSRYTFRLATGHDVEHALGLAQTDGELDNDRYLMALVNRLSIEPKITVEYWGLLGEDDPAVKGALTRGFLRPSGLMPGAVAEAKNSSGETAS
jgi:hypothetical protein